MEKELKMEKIEQLKTKEKEPKILYHFLYAPHKTIKDRQDFEAAFKETDIYAPEAFGDSAKILNFFNKLSQGEMTPQQFADKLFLEPGLFAFEEFRVIYNSHKPILFIDVPPGHELLEISDQIDKYYEESTDLFKKGKFKPALQMMRKFVIGEVDLEQKREEIIKKSLKEKIKEFVKNHPQLKDKNEVRVLSTLGAAHTRIYHDFKKEGFLASQQFTYQPFVFDSIAEAVRRRMFFRDEQPSNILLARGIIEAFLFTYFIRRVTNDSNKAFMVGRKISSRLDLKDIKKISKEFSKQSGLDITPILETRDIKVPKTEEEMNEMLKIKERK